MQSDRGPHGGFQLLAGYRNQLSSLENHEAQALFMIGMPGPALAMGLGKAAKHASRKLLASLPPGLRQQSSQVAACFYLDTVDWYQAQPAVPGLPQLARAVLDQKQISVRYTSWTNTRDWQMEALGLVLKAGNWYLVANSVVQGSSVKKIRSFKVAHMAHMQTHEAGFVRPVDFNLSQYWHDSIAEFEKTLRPMSAKVRVTQLGLDRIAALGQFAQEAVDIAKKTQAGVASYELSLPYENLEQAAHMLLGIGPELSVLAPPELRLGLRELALCCISLNEE